MFKALGIEQYGMTGRTAIVKLYATTKEEVVDGAEIEGLPANYQMESGSWGYTQAGDLFIYDEETGYKFVGDEDSDAKALNATLGKTLLGGVKPSVEPSEEEAVEEEPIEEIEE